MGSEPANPQDIYPALPTGVDTPFETDPVVPTTTTAFDPTVTPPEWVDQQFPDTDKGITG